MISIDCTHPDLLEFINIKTKEGSVTKANISVKVTDDFMKAVEEDKEWELYYKRKETGEEIKITYPAKTIFHILCENNWDWAEPGILYWDSISNWNLLSNNSEFEYAGTNPCAEEPLPAGGSCLLGSINLSEFVENPFTPEASVNKDELVKTVFIAVDALNEVLDEGLPLHPLQEQRKTVKDWRQIGLGIMGLADMLIKLGIRYGSKESLEKIEDIMSIIVESAIMESNYLASTNEPYPKYTEDVIKTPFFQYCVKNKTLISDIETFGLRNSQLLTCAPTGSIATMLGISNGIEPLYATSWTRKTESLHGEDVYYVEHPKIIKQLMGNLNLGEESKLPNYIVTSHDLKPIERIMMQSTLQKYIDASISSTINLPNSATVSDVEEIYMEAWRKGLKGVTIYREGCKRTGILDSGNSKKEEDKKENDTGLKRGEVFKVNDHDAIGFKRKLMTGCGSLHCTAYFDVNTGDLVETYLSKGSTGGCNNFMVGLSRMISTVTRAGVSIQEIVDQLMSTGSCPSYAVRSATKHDTSKGSCCPMAVGYALKEMWEEFQGKEMKPKEIQQTKKENKNIDIKKPKCPECGAELIFEGGCNICKECGFTKCD